MPETPNTADRMVGLLVIVATLATIGVNALAALGLINGVTPATISERHPSLITPAGYAFSIWSLIYLWLVAFSIYQLLSDGRFKNIRWLYLASCVLNIAWLWFWHHGEIAICLVLIIGLNVVLFEIVRRLRSPLTLRDGAFVKAPFGIYFGWVTCAMLVNLNILTTNVGDAPRFLLALGILSIAFATVAAVLVSFKLDNHLYPLAVAWALTAIAVKQGSNTPIIVATALGTVICLVAAGSVVTKLKDSTSE